MKFPLMRSSNLWLHYEMVMDTYAVIVSSDEKYHIEKAMFLKITFYEINEIIVV